MYEYLDGWRRLFQWSGKASRQAFWQFMLVNLLISAILVGIDASLNWYGALEGLYSALALIPTLSVSVRRLHDIGQSGWCLLLIMIPVIGVLWLLWLLAQPGEDPGSIGFNPSTGGIK